MNATKFFQRGISNILEQQTLRWIFVGGKGGVGKTTVSSSLSLILAETRPTDKILIISTDPAHNLSDAFDQKIGPQPILIEGTENLYGLEIEPKINTDNIANMSQLLGFEADNATLNLIGDISSSIPGIDEAMSIGYVMRIVRDLNFSVVVFDTAPTGHTMRLLNFPQLLNQGLEKLMTLKEKFSGMLSSVSGLFSGSLESVYEGMFANLSALKDNIDEINRQFKDQTKTTFVAVCIPEFLSVYETERLIKDLFNFDIDIRNIVVNQVLFQRNNDNCSMCSARRKMQGKYLKDVLELYDDFYVNILPLQESEIRGLSALNYFKDFLLNPPDFE